MTGGEIWPLALMALFIVTDLALVAVQLRLRRELDAAMIQAGAARADLVAKSAELQRMCEILRALSAPPPTPPA